MTVETGAYCGQSNGSCIVRCGDTVVMVNATMSKAPRDGMDFFPLSVDYEEKMYAIGKIPGGFKKREGRASDKAILTSRLIDRPIRPLFPKGLYNDVTVIATVLSVDTNIPPEVFGMIGSSVALSISDIPWAGPTGSVVVGMVDGEYVINPDSAQRAKSRLTLNLSGTKDAIMMVEAGADVITEKKCSVQSCSVTKRSKRLWLSSKKSKKKSASPNSIWISNISPTTSTKLLERTQTKNGLRPRSV